MATVTETELVPFWHETARADGEAYDSIVSPLVERALETTARLGVDPPVIDAATLEEILGRLMDERDGTADERLKSLPPKLPDTYWSTEREALLQLDVESRTAAVIVRDHDERTVTREVPDEPETGDDGEPTENEG